MVYISRSNKLLVSQSNDLLGLSGLLSSMAIDQPIISDPYVVNEKVLVDISVEGRTSLRWYADTELVELPMPQTVELQQGLGKNIDLQVVFAFWSEEDDEYSVAVSSVLPEGSFLPLCYAGIQTHAEVTAYGPMVLQRTTETVSQNQQGALSRMREHTRLAEDKKWWRGAEMTFAENSGVLSFKVLSSIFYQMNRQASETLDSAVDGFFVVNSQDTAEKITNYSRHTDLSDLKYLSNGEEITTGEYVSFYTYMAGNNTPGNCKLLVRLPGHSHDTLEELEELVDHSRAPGIDPAFRSVGFPVGIILMKYLGNGAFENAFTITTETTEWSWKEYACNIKSPNWPDNYGHSENETYQITGPVGATKISIVFDEYFTETNYDFLMLKAGTSYPAIGSSPRLHNNLGIFTSVVLNNRVVSMRFTSDGSVSRSGFKSSKYKAYVPTVITTSEQSIKVLDARNKA